VIARNPNVKHSSNWKTTDYSVEIAVTSVLKGSEIGLLDRIRVESDAKEWIGKPNEMPTGWNGVGAPSVNAQVLVYLAGSKSKGFRFVEPNGFVDLQRLRANSVFLQSHVSSEEWETIERNIGNVAPVRSEPINSTLSMTVLLLFVAIAIFIAFWWIQTEPSDKLAQTNAG
jgi:hypothetical protein